MTNLPGKLGKASGRRGAWPQNAHTFLNLIPSTSENHDCKVLLYQELFLLSQLKNCSGRLVPLSIEMVTKLRKVIKDLLHANVTGGYF